jgi:DNA-binding NtrC family response regulator
MVITLEPKEEFSISILVIDDEQVVLDLMSQAFNGMPVRLSATRDSGKGLQLLKRQQPRLVFLDLNLPNVRGMDLLEEILRIDPRTEVVLITGDYSPSSAVEAIQRGAADYLTKPLSIAELRAKVQQAIEAARRKQMTAELEAELLSSFQFRGVVGRSPAMLEVLNKMRRVAPHFRSILISGPSGSGKELVARGLHDLSSRRNGPFVACNCAGIPEPLAESEMFGNVRGAFTGAERERLGFFEQANGGTIFLDEVAEASLELQVKLLRVLQTHEIQRVGSPISRKLDIRVVAATNRDLREEVSEGRFREDLFYRLSTVHLRLPALAERKEDLPLLQRYFVEKFAKEYRKDISGITRRAQTLLSQHSWPGNIRELENVIAHACMMSTGLALDIDDFPENIRSGGSLSSNPPLSLKALQQKHTLDVLNRVNGNKARAAEILGISRSTLYNILIGKDFPGDS